ncbi:hypothetical protein [Halorubrum sp. AJ67]|uniref:hypothetical protein n=1 Tax=Halorubrum sp. AJ67 TaxID=1173487 RepID=UPI0003DD0B45|nr:hypothetical protein [Halorubrum sp. AJ67]CDK38008.1 uncharacterized protein domain protein [Halorubrum sp. AJ67]
MTTAERETTEPRSFTPITEHPLPFSDGLSDFLESHPQFDADDDVGVDELHEEYTTTLADNGFWRVFRVDLHGYNNWVYLWHSEYGDGLKIPTGEWQFGNFAEVFALLLSDEPGTIDDHTGDGCPYCQGTLSSSLQQSGSHKQTCTRCGRSRIIG